MMLNVSTSHLLNPTWHSFLICSNLSRVTHVRVVKHLKEEGEESQIEGYKLKLVAVYDQVVSARVDSGYQFAFYKKTNVFKQEDDEDSEDAAEQQAYNINFTDFSRKGSKSINFDDTKDH